MCHIPNNSHSVMWSITVLFSNLFWDQAPKSPSRFKHNPPIHNILLNCMLNCQINFQGLHSIP